MSGEDTRETSLEVLLDEKEAECVNLIRSLLKQHGAIEVENLRSLVQKEVNVNDEEFLYSYLSMTTDEIVLTEANDGVIVAFDPSADSSIPEQWRIDIAAKSIISIDEEQ